MKLLSKSEVNKAKSIDRQREVDEGLKLAKRVDALREVAAQEDASLQKFRRETLARISTEILFETTKRDTLKQEVSDLEERKRVALVPLTEAWEDVEEEREILTGLRDLLDAREARLRLNEADAEERAKEVARAEQVVSYTQADATDRLEKAAILKDDADNLKRIASEELQQARNTAQTLIISAEERVEQVSKREKECLQRESDLDKREKELNDNLIRLRDREGVLARNLKRNG